MTDGNPVNIAELVSAPPLRESIECCAMLARARVSVVDVQGRVVATSGGPESPSTDAGRPTNGGTEEPGTCAEIRCGANVIGQVCCRSEKPEATAAIQWLGRELSARATDQVDLDSLSQELLGMYEEINLVYDFSAAIASVFDEGRIADLVLERVMKAIQAERGVVTLVDQGADHAHVAASRNVPAHGAGAMADLVVVGLCERVARSGKAEVVDAASDPASGKDGLLSPPLACSPLTADGSVIGVITLSREARDGNFTAGDLKLLNAIASQLAIAIHNVRLVEEVKAQERLRRELEIAASIQASLLPESPPDTETIDIAARTIAAERVGGDYYGFFKGARGRVGLVIADVSGHSIAAALMAATLRSVIHAATVQGGSPAEVVERVNRMIYTDLENASMLVSMFYAEYDPGSSTLAYANAGHNRPILWRGGQASVVEAPGLLLGVLEQHDFPQGQLSLQPGDAVLLYTDGLIEAENDARKQYGEDRLMQSVSRNGSQPLEQLMAACLREVQDHAGTESLYDDVTMIAIRQK